MPLLLLRGFRFLFITIFLLFNRYHISNSHRLWFRFGVLLRIVIARVLLRVVVAHVLLRFWIVIVIVVVVAFILDLLWRLFLLPGLILCNSFRLGSARMLRLCGSRSYSRRRDMFLGNNDIPRRRIVDSA